MVEKMVTRRKKVYRIVLMLLLIVVAACKPTEGSSENEKPWVKTSAEVEVRVKRYDQQEFHFGLSGCYLMFDGKPFELGGTVNSLKSLIGPYDYFNLGFYVWEKYGVMLYNDNKIAPINRRENMNEPLTALKVYLNTQVDERDKEDLKHLLSTQKEWFMIQGVPFKADMSFNKFIESSRFSYDDFSVDDHGYKYTQPCTTPDVSWLYSFSVQGGWLYSGGGHLQYKTEINRNNSNLVESISVVRVLDR